MGTGRKYTNPNAAGYLLEAEACKKVVKELERLVEKYQRKISRANAVRQAEFEAAMEYHSERDIQDAYGWDIITEAQYDRSPCNEHEFAACQKVKSLKMFKNNRVDVKFADEACAEEFIDRYLGAVC